MEPTKKQLYLEFARKTYTIGCKHYLRLGPGDYPNRCTRVVENPKEFSINDLKNNHFQIFAEPGRRVLYDSTINEWATCDGKKVKFPQDEYEDIDEIINKLELCQLRLLQNT